MNFSVKVAVALLIACGAVLVVRHAQRAVEATLPADMPADSQFWPSGFNIANSEAKGNWVACRVDTDQATDWCRITDQTGSVVFQGDYLPARSAKALAASQLQIAKAIPAKMWVKGPVEQGPVPVIALTNGELLVPAADRDALIQRWSTDASEYNRISNGD